MKRLYFLLLALLLGFISCQPDETQYVKEQYLTEGWQLTGDTLDIALEVMLPSVVQGELAENGLLPDPYLGQAEAQYQWISDHNWKYTLHFNVDRDILNSEFIDLVFEGIDTYADVVLNGQKIFSADNMFRTWTVPMATVRQTPIEAIRDIVQEVYPLREIDNVLEITFPRYDSIQSALYEQAVPRFPERYAMSRKAPYQHGWDWAPKYKNIGLWKPVKLVGYSGGRIESANVVTDKVEGNRAELRLLADLRSHLRVDASLLGTKHKETPHQVTLQLLLGEEKYAEKTYTLTEDRSVSIPFSINYPKLWWPNEMGEQAFYDFTLRLYFDGEITDERSIRTGIKTFEMVDQPDAKGREFYFMVNGVPIYAKGANYVPEEMIETWMDAGHTFELLRQAKDAHFNMLRVWGGGVYPNEDFFNACDAMGLLVWEDFMYAGTMYPYDSMFLDNARIEAEQQVKRLASHPSLALWCGGNEISEGYYNWGWQKSLDWSKEDDMAMKAGYDTLFESILPQAVAECDGTRPYWPSSPSKGWGRKESLTEGDVHYWGVWWGELPFEVYRDKVGRFNSEYGYQSYPDYRSLTTMADGEELDKDSEVIAAHQKHARGTRQIDDFIRRYYPYPENFEDYVYMSQLSQAYGMEIAIEAHRTAKPYNMGTLYWQLNDAWPVVSWSSVDYYGRPKAMQYKLKSLYAPLLLSLGPKDHSIYITSDVYELLEGTLKASVKDFEGNVLFEKALDVAVADFQNVRYKVEGLDKFLKKAKKNSVYVKLEFEGNDSIAPVRSERFCYLALPKDLDLPEESLQVDYESKEGEVVISLRSEVLVKDLQLYTKAGEGRFSDNFFDLEPGVTKRIVFIPKEAQEEFGFGYRCLNRF